MITTTLKKIRAHSPCEDGWKKLYESLFGHKSGKQQKTHWIIFIKHPSLYKSTRPER